MIGRAIGFRRPSILRQARAPRRHVKALELGERPASRLHGDDARRFDFSLVAC